MNKGIFWVYFVCFDDDMCYPTVINVKVKCDINGNPLEPVEFSSKSGDNFNHKIEWANLMEEKKPRRKKPFDYYPRGRVEIKNGKIRIFANPVIVADDEAKEAIIECFELEENKEAIQWIADNSKHYKYVHDAMGDCLADDEEEED